MAKVVTVSKKPNNNAIHTMKDLATHIKYKRTKLGITRVDAAGFCGIGVSTLENIENGNEKCDIGKVLKVAKELGIKLEVKGE